jgi:hypothetical protein
VNDYFSSRAAGIWKELAAWATAAAIVGASPAIYAAPQPTFYPGSPAVLSAGYSTSSATTYSTGNSTNLDDVLREVSVAKRLLKTFGGDFLPEFDSYLSTLEAVLATDINSVSSATRLGSGLRAARVRFEEEASSVKVWARLVSCIDQKPVSGRRLPRRFVKVRVRQDEAPFGDERSNIWAHKAARDFANVDADPSPRAT